MQKIRCSNKLCRSSCKTTEQWLIQLQWLIAQGPPTKCVFHTFPTSFSPSRMNSSTRSRYSSPSLMRSRPYLHSPFVRASQARSDAVELKLKVLDDKLLRAQISEEEKLKVR